VDWNTIYKRKRDNAEINVNDYQDLQFEKAVKFANEYFMDKVLGLYTQWIPA